MTKRGVKNGYLLLEAIVAMGVLSAGVIAVNQSLHRAVLMRATSDDYTRAAFLLGEIIGPLEVQYDVPEMMREGSLGDKKGENGLERFQYKVQVENYDLPLPELPPELPPEMAQAIEEAGKSQLRKIMATVSWTRAGQSFSYSAQTVVFQKPAWTETQVSPEQSKPAVTKETTGQTRPNRTINRRGSRNSPQKQ